LSSRTKFCGQENSSAADSVMSFEAIKKMNRNGTTKKIPVRRMAAIPMTRPRVFFIRTPPLG
jgi:hypothetical protein